MMTHNVGRVPQRPAHRGSMILLALEELIHPQEPVSPFFQDADQFRQPIIEFIDPPWVRTDVYEDHGAVQTGLFFQGQESI